VGLSIDLFHLFRDLEGVPDDVFRKNLDRIMPLVATIFSTVQRLRSRGVAFLATSDNYDEDLAAHVEVSDEFVERLRTHAVLYDRSNDGECFDIPTETFVQWSVLF
jgi:4-hydroxyphenylpyruvate dioxygenase-like putative hemolysin